MTDLACQRVCSTVFRSIPEPTVAASLCLCFNPSGVATLDSGFLQRNTGMMRYQMNKVAGADAWIVLDTTTGFPAVVKGIPQIGLSLDDADDLTDLLNRLDAEAQLATKN